MCKFVLKSMSVSPVGCLSKVCRLLPSLEHGLEDRVFNILNGMYPVFDPSQRIFRDPSWDRARNSMNRDLPVKFKLLQNYFRVLACREKGAVVWRHKRTACTKSNFVLVQLVFLFRYLIE